jgi:hypothetical protein
MDDRSRLPEDQALSLILAALRGEEVRWPQHEASGLRERFLERCASQGVAGMVWHQCHSTPAWESWPREIRESLTDAIRIETALDDVRAVELSAVIEALAQAGVRALLMKGAGLAYTHYPDSALRPRQDSDILIAPQQIRAVYRALRRRGYRRCSPLLGTYQFIMVKRGVHVMDVHWRVSDTVPFAHAFSYAELAARASRVPALGARASTLGPADALVVACLHRAHHGEERLIWLYDLHLLASAMDRDDFRQVVASSTEKGIGHVVAAGLAAAVRYFGSRLPGPVPADWVTGSAAPEPFRAFPQALRVRYLVPDLRALRGAYKLRMLWDLAFPDRASLRQLKTGASSAFFPLRYPYRWARALRRLARSHDTTR